MTEESAYVLRLVRIAALLLFTPFAFIGLLAAIGHALRFNDHLELPNGMIAKRQFDFTRSGRDDLFAADGSTRLARSVEFVCFDDRFVYATSYEPTEGGIFDGQTGGRIKRRDYEAFVASSGTSSLFPKGKTCDGYYTGMLGPGLLYGYDPPFQPSCDWRNLDNPSLRDRSWFDRPCRD